MPIDPCADVYECFTSFFNTDAFGSDIIFQDGSIKIFGKKDIATAAEYEDRFFSLRKNTFKLLLASEAGKGLGFDLYAKGMVGLEWYIFLEHKCVKWLKAKGKHFLTAFKIYLGACQLAK